MTKRTTNPKVILTGFPQEYRSFLTQIQVHQVPPGELTRRQLGTPEAAQRYCANFRAWRHNLRKHPEAYAAAKRIHLQQVDNDCVIVSIDTKPKKGTTMPKAKALSAYPQVMFDLDQPIQEGIFRIPFPDKRAAEKQRFEFYALRAALRKEQASEVFPGLAFSQITLEDAQDHWNLVFTMPQFNSQYAGLYKALEQRKPVSPPPLPPTFAPSLSDPPPSSTYHAQEVVSEFENLIDSWMAGSPAERQPEHADGSPAPPSPDSENKA